MSHARASSWPTSLAPTRPTSPAPSRQRHRATPSSATPTATAAPPSSSSTPVRRARPSRSAWSTLRRGDTWRGWHRTKPVWSWRKRFVRFDVLLDRPGWSARRGSMSWLIRWPARGVGPVRDHGRGARRGIQPTNRDETGLCTTQETWPTMIRRRHEMMLFSTCQQRCALSRRVRRSGHRLGMSQHSWSWLDDSYRFQARWDQLVPIELDLVHEHDLAWVEGHRSLA